MATPSNSDFQVVQKQVKLRPQKPKEAVLIAGRHGLSSVAARILAARGYRDDSVLENYLDPVLKTGLPPPEKLLNLNKACATLSEIITAGRPVAICCDFDVDGLSGGAQIYHFFKTLGVKSRVFVPDRFADGYGLNFRTVEEVAKGGFGALLTIDFGTTNLKELALAKKLGLVTVVVDHHHVSQEPPCDIFINPQQSGCGFADKVLCASGLAWYLLLGLRSCLKNSFPKAAELDPRAYLDLTCLGTICDMVPLTGVNRVIARRGLELLAATKRLGLCALKRTMNVRSEISCYDVSFGLGPRLNAAGRMVHGEMVIELLTTDDEGLAARLARQLHELNGERQETEREVKELAIKQLRTRYSGPGLPAGLVVWDENFHTGVVGLVAQRLVESFYRPAVVLGTDEQGTFKGSVRGIKGFNVVEALSSVSGTLLKFGGHEGAGGLSLEKERLQEFVEAFEDECSRRLRKLDKSPSAEADTEVNLSEVDVHLVEELKRFAPFGMGNPSPLLLARRLTVTDVRDIKGQHLKARLSDGKYSVSGLMWRQSSHPALRTDAKVDVVFKPDVSNYNGLTEIQAHLNAVEPAR